MAKPVPGPPIDHPPAPMSIPRPQTDHPLAPMPVPGQPVDLLTALGWLGGEQNLAALEVECLNYFLELKRNQYTSSQKDGFIKDFRAQDMQPLKTPDAQPAFIIESLNHMLANINRKKGDAPRMEYMPRLQIVYKKEPLNLAMCKNTIFYARQKEIGLSRSGKTHLYTANFEGCLGVCIIPKSDQGGVLAHISEGGFKDGNKKYEYFLEIIKRIVDWAAEYWTECDMILFRGETTKGPQKVLDVFLPDLPTRILAMYTGDRNMRIRDIHDLRPFAPVADGHILDVKRRKFYQLPKSLDGDGVTLEEGESSCRPYHIVWDTFDAMHEQFQKSEFGFVHSKPENIMRGYMLP